MVFTYNLGNFLALGVIVDFFFGHFPPEDFSFSFLPESSSAMFGHYKTIVEVVCE